jgi:hypothetical protein
MKRSIVALVLMAGLLGACAGPDQMRSEVTRFHQLPVPAGPVAVVPADQHNMGSIEFNRYAQQVASRLAAVGFPPPSGGEPDYIAEFDYSQQPVAVDDAGSGPYLSFGMGSGSYGNHSAVGVGVSTGFDLSGRDRGETAMRTVTLVIERRADGSRVFEGRVQSIGPAANFPSVIPYMLDAMFSNFPGESGRTIVVNSAVQPPP